jgi:bifunctional DNA-binding transcriptional regulator/antitoxin component of YhaV-PrlF toxin-antitoxin module
MGSTEVVVSRNGQVSVPAEVRHRWGARTVLIIDRGDYAIVRPVPDDPIGAIQGAYAGPGRPAEDVRSENRTAEADAEERRRDSSR